MIHYMMIIFLPRSVSWKEWDRVYRKRSKFNLQDCILLEGNQNFNDTEFLHSFRMTIVSFHLLLDEMKTKRAFRMSKFKKQWPVAFQLLVFLFHIGREGTAGSNLAVSQYFGIGIGSVGNYVKYTIWALKEIKNKVVYWPNNEEKEQMKSRLACTGFRHCVVIIDGTLIVLDFRPPKVPQVLLLLQIMLHTQSNDCVWWQQANYILLYWVARLHPWQPSLA